LKCSWISKYPFHCCFSWHLLGSVGNCWITVILVYYQMFSTGNSVHKCQTPFKYFNTRTVGQINDKRLKSVWQVPGDSTNFQQISRISRRENSTKFSWFPGVLDIIFVDVIIICHSNNHIYNFTQTYPSVRRNSAGLDHSHLVACTRTQHCTPLFTTPYRHNKQPISCDGQLAPPIVAVAADIRAFLWRPVNQVKEASYWFEIRDHQLQ